MRGNCTKAFAFAAAVAAIPATASAQSTDSQTTSNPAARPVMLSEGSGLTDVVDAFDLGSLWSFRFTAEYYRSNRTATVQRERSTITHPMGSMTPITDSGETEFDDVAHYTEVTQTLNLGAELAVYHDFALTFGLPIILSWSQSLDPAANLTAAQANALLGDGYSYGMGGMMTPTQLFNLPFRSPDRSGIDQIRVGFKWDILNQARDRHMPTWLFRFEGRIPLGSPLQPCEQDASGHAQCPQSFQQSPPPDFTYDPGTNNVPMQYTRPLQSSPDVGISRRVYGLYIQTVMSRNLGYFEPYAGLDFLLEIPESNTQTFRYGDVPYGQLSSYPPIQGSLVAGTEITPWANRESWQRFVIDVYLQARYYSQGRDFSPLFDALGSSNSIPLATPNYAINDQMMTRPVYFTGTTGIASHADVSAHLGFIIQPARFLRFSFGGSLMYTTPYHVTATDACNPNVQPVDGSQRGGCVGDAVPDPMHRPVIDAAGQRFRLVDDITWDIYVNLAFTPRF